MPTCARFLFIILVFASSCARTRPTETSPRPQISSAKTLTFSILEDYDKGNDLVDVARDFALFRELGIHTWRGSFGWDDYEPDRGQFDFAWLHAFIQLADTHAITLRPYIGYTPDWAAGGTDRDGQAWNQPPRDQRAWSGFLKALGDELQHHKNVGSVEIYNEQNVAQWWEGSVGDYAATLRSAADALRGFELLAGGLVFPDEDWIEALCADFGGGPAFAVLPVHAYPETWTPEGVTVENYLGTAFRDGFVATADRECGRKRIWINETGFATIPGRSEHDQASWWVRAVATFAAEPRVEHIGVYEIKDLSPDRPAIGDAPNYHLGLTHTDRRPKLAFATMKLLVRLFGGSPLTLGIDARVTRARPAGTLYHHSFRRQDGQSIVVIWNAGADEDVELEVPPGASITEYDLGGRSTDRTAGANGLAVSLQRGTPRIFVLTPRP